MPYSKRLSVSRVAADLSMDQLADTAWEAADEIKISRDWSGKEAPVDRRFSARLLWSDAAIYVRFDASQGEPMVVNARPDLTQKTVGLWNSDVCEIFIAPDKNVRQKYFEFEIAPTAEWVDLAIEITREGRKTDLEYNSGITSAARVEEGRIVMAIRIPWDAFGRKPRSGDVWLGNLFRCVGKEPNRGYLAWQPTKTPEPDFHVPDVFGELHFLDRKN